MTHLSGSPPLIRFDWHSNVKNTPTCPLRTTSPASFSDWRTILDYFRPYRARSQTPKQSPSKSTILWVNTNRFLHRLAARNEQSQLSPSPWKLATQPIVSNYHAYKLQLAVLQQAFVESEEYPSYQLRHCDDNCARVFLSTRRC